MVLLNLTQYFRSCRVSRISTTPALFPIITDEDNKFKQTKTKNSYLQEPKTAPTSEDFVKGVVGNIVVKFVLSNV